MNIFEIVSFVYQMKKILAKVEEELVSRKVKLRTKVESLSEKIHYNKIYNTAYFSN